MPDTGTMVTDLPETTTLDDNDLLYVVASDVSQKITKENFRNNVKSDELLDIRTGAKGEAYTSAGEAVRTQITDVEKIINFEADRSDSVSKIEYQTVDYSKCAKYKNGYYMNESGNLVSAGQHAIISIPAKNITRISYVLKRASGNIPIFVIKDAENNVVKYEFANRSTLVDLESYFDFPAGLPEGCVLYCNWYNANVSSYVVVDSMNILYKDCDTRIVVGRNKFNKDKATQGFAIAYDNGTQVINASYASYGIAIDANVTFSVSSKCHIAYFNQYGNYISGNVNGDNPGSYTTPTGTKGVVVSPQIAKLGSFQFELASSLSPYEPFRYMFNTDNPSGYSSGQIHFTVPINQTIIKHGQNVATSVDSEDVVNVNALIELPSSYSISGKPVPLIMITHGSGFYVSASNWGYSGDGSEGSSTEFNTMIAGFVNAGYAVCDINAYDNTIPRRTWGCPRVLYAYRKLYEYVTNNFNVQKTVNVFGFSMGGMVAINFALYNKDIIKSIALASPVIGLWDQVYHGTAEWKRSLATAYGFEGADQITFVDGSPTSAETTLWNNNESLVVGYDPIKKIIEINQVEYNFEGFPFMRAWHGTSDAISYTYTQRFINSLRNNDKGATLRLVNGAGHEICYGGNSICNNEYVLWFNRFNDKIA